MNGWSPTVCYFMICVITQNDDFEQRNEKASSKTQSQCAKE